MIPDQERPSESRAAEPPPGYRTQSEDTSYWADRMLFEHLRTLDSRQTVELIGAACRMMDELLILGLRREHPFAGAEELRLRAAALKYGREFVERMTGLHVPHP